MGNEQEKEIDADNEAGAQGSEGQDLSRRQAISRVAAVLPGVAAAALLADEVAAQGVTKAQLGDLELGLAPANLARAAAVNNSLMSRLSSKMQDTIWVKSFVDNPERAMLAAGFNARSEFKRFDAKSRPNQLAGHDPRATTICASVGGFGVCGGIGGDV